MARRGRAYYDRDGTGHFFVDGVEVDQATYDAAFPSKFHQLLEGGDAALPGGQHAAGWPMESKALACHSSQVEAMAARNKKHGITGVSYKPDGTCVIDSPGERAKLMKLERVHDNNGGYRG